MGVAESTAMEPSDVTDLKTRFVEVFGGEFGGRHPVHVVRQDELDIGHPQARSGHRGLYHSGDGGGVLALEPSLLGFGLKGRLVVLEQ